jgi:hypothetical protein
VRQNLILRWIAVGLLSLGFFSLGASACDISANVRVATNDDIKRFFAGEKKAVVTFVGYSGAGYEDEAAMLQEAERILDALDASSTIVNIGATAEGIGAVYALAKGRGFTTTGIVSTQAREYGAELSPCVDRVFYVEDASWGGFMKDSDRLSPTSAAMVENSDVLIGIGGGAVGRDELIAAKRSGKEVRYIPADMNHQKAREKASRKGLPEPADFAGAASELFRGNAD